MFVRFQYIFFKRENVDLTTCFTLFGHHVFLQLIYLLHEGNCCSIVVLVVVIRMIFVPFVCAC
jgi:membrane protein insertase Oxa1/YidC/SpoIIIJ